VAGVGQEDGALMAHAPVHLPLLEGFLARGLGQLGRGAYRHLHREEGTLELDLNGRGEDARGYEHLGDRLRGSSGGQCGAPILALAGGELRLGGRPSCSPDGSG
jgi:hypothetical protein